MMQNEPQQGGSMGSLIGIIVIIAIIILGGIYFWGKKNSAQNPTDTQSIENDLNSIDISTDADLNAIDTSLQGQ